MGYTYEKNEASKLFEAGDYEARIERIEKRVLPSGKEKLSFMFRIRDDVEQAEQNRCVFDDIWKERDNPEHYNRRRINQLLGTQDIEDGKTFADIDAVIEELQGASLIVHVVKTFDDYIGQEVNKVAYYKTSAHKPSQVGSTSAPVIDDDLPF